MKKQSFLPLLALVGGVAAFVLRLLQNRTGFEAATGLPIPGNAPGLALVALLTVLALAFLLLVRRLPREADPGPAFPEEFSSGSAGQVFLPVAGALLMLLSGLADLAEALGGVNLLARLQAAADPYGAAAMESVSGFAPKAQLLLGLLSLVSGAAVFLAAAACRRGSREAGSSFQGALLLAPPVALVVRLVLAYRLDSINPALEAYYVELLGLVFLTLGFYRLSSFAFQSGRTWRFALYACVAVVLCIAALADGGPRLSSLLLYTGGAATLLGFLLLRLAHVPGDCEVHDSTEDV